MKDCEQQASGIVELYFYDELDASARASVERHLGDCAECRQTLDDLSVIRTALLSRVQVDAPQGGDWGAFMVRLDAAIESDTREFGSSGPRELGHSNVRVFQPSGDPISRGAEAPKSRLNSRVWHYASYFATAALLTLVTSGIWYIGKHAAQSNQPGQEARIVPVAPATQPPSESTASYASGFAALSEQHFERSKLVVLGLANKDLKDVSQEDWAYERGLASNLLDDTRLYRMSAEERGLTTIAGVMSDLELVLLQTSMADVPDAETLDRIQRLIQKRDLVTKIDAAATGS